MTAAHITKTEDSVIRLRLLGLTVKEIANKKFRSAGTIQRHFQNIFYKLDVHSEIELYNWYAENVLNINIRKMLQVAVCLTLMLVLEMNCNLSIIRTRTITVARVETVRTKTNKKEAA